MFLNNPCLISFRKNVGWEMGQDSKRKEGPGGYHIKKGPTGSFLWKVWWVRSVKCCDCDICVGCWQQWESITDWS